MPDVGATATTKYRQVDEALTQGCVEVAQLRRIADVQLV